MMLKEALITTIIMFTVIIPVVPVVAYHLVKGVAAELVDFWKSR